MVVRIPANGWKPRPYQLPAWSYLERGGSHAETIWHRRAGKDDVAAHHTACSSTRRIGNYWHMLPQANQARKALWNAVNQETGRRRIDEWFPPEIRTQTRDDEMLIRFAWGSTWQVVGSDNFNSLVGSSPIGLVFSEWALCDPASWAYLMPIVEQNHGWVIFNGTPRGKNHAFRSLRGAQKTTGSFAQVLTAEQTGVFNEAQLVRIRQELINTYGEEYGQSIFEQEYLCSFEAANLGAILGRALSKAHREGRISDERGAYDPNGAPIEISSDIGRRDASTWWFWQPCYGGFRIVDYDKDSGLDGDEWCDRLQTRIKGKGYNLGKIWLPHDARAKTFSAKHSAVEIFIQRFGVDKLGIVPNSTRADRINAARRVIGQCAFHETNTEKGRDGLSSWSFVYDEERKEFSKEPDHTWASHDGDGFSYGCQVMDQREPQKESEKERLILVGPENTYTMEDAWRDHEVRIDRRERI